MQDLHTVEKLFLISFSQLLANTLWHFLHNLCWPSSLRMVKGISLKGSISNNWALWVLTSTSLKFHYIRLVLLPSQIFLHCSGSFLLVHLMELLVSQTITKSLVQSTRSSGDVELVTSSPPPVLSLEINFAMATSPFSGIQMSVVLSDSDRRDFRILVWKLARGRP